MGEHIGACRKASTQLHPSEEPTEYAFDNSSSAKQGQTKAIQPASLLLPLGHISADRVTGQTPGPPSGADERRTYGPRWLPALGRTFARPRGGFRGRPQKALGQFLGAFRRPYSGTGPPGATSLAAPLKSPRWGSRRSVRPRSGSRARARTPPPCLPRGGRPFAGGASPVFSFGAPVSHRPAAFLWPATVAGRASPGQRSRGRVPPQAFPGPTVFGAARPQHRRRRSATVTSPTAALYHRHASPPWRASRAATCAARTNVHGPPVRPPGVRPPPSASSCLPPFIMRFSRHPLSSCRAPFFGHTGLPWQPITPTAVPPASPVRRVMRIHPAVPSRHTLGSSATLSVTGAGGLLAVSPPSVAGSTSLSFFSPPLAGLVRSPPSFSCTAPASLPRPRTPSPTLRPADPPSRGDARSSERLRPPTTCGVLAARPSTARFPPRAAPSPPLKRRPGGPARIIRPRRT